MSHTGGSSSGSDTDIDVEGRKQELDLKSQKKYDVTSRDYEIFCDNKVRSTADQAQHLVSADVSELHAFTLLAPVETLYPCANQQLSFLFAWRPYCWNFECYGARCSCAFANVFQSYILLWEKLRHAPRSFCAGTLALAWGFYRGVHPPPLWDIVFSYLNTRVLVSVTYRVRSCWLTGWRDEPEASPVMVLAIMMIALDFSFNTRCQT